MITYSYTLPERLLTTSSKTDKKARYPRSWLTASIALGIAKHPTVTSRTFKHNNTSSVKQVEARRSFFLSPFCCRQIVQCIVRSLHNRLEGRPRPDARLKPAASSLAVDPELPIRAHFPISAHGNLSHTTARRRHPANFELRQRSGLKP